MWKSIGSDSVWSPVLLEHVLSISCTPQVHEVPEGGEFDAGLLTSSLQMSSCQPTHINSTQQTNHMAWSVNNNLSSNNRSFESLFSIHNLTSSIKYSGSQDNGLENNNSGSSDIGTSQEIPSVDSTRLFFSDSLNAAAAENANERCSNDYAFVDDVHNKLINQSSKTTGSSASNSNVVETGEKFMSMNKDYQKRNAHIRDDNSNAKPSSNNDVRQQDLLPPVPPRGITLLPPLPCRSESSHLLAMRLLDGHDRRSLSPKSGLSKVKSVDLQRNASERLQRPLVVRPPILLKNRSFSDPNFLKQINNKLQFLNEEENAMPLPDEGGDSNNFVTDFSNGRVSRRQNSFSSKNLNFEDTVNVMVTTVHSETNNKAKQPNSHNFNESFCEIPPKVPDRTDSLEGIQNLNSFNYQFQVHNTSITHPIHTMDRTEGQQIVPESLMIKSKVEPGPTGGTAHSQLYFMNDPRYQQWSSYRTFAKFPESGSALLVSNQLTPVSNATKQLPTMSASVVHPPVPLPRSSLRGTLQSCNDQSQGNPQSCSVQSQNNHQSCSVLQSEGSHQCCRVQSQTSNVIIDSAVNNAGVSSTKVFNEGCGTL